MNAREFLAPLAAMDGQDEGLQSLAGLHAADALACLLAGTQTPEGAALAAFYDESGLQPPLAAAAAAAAIIRLTEWDDIHVPSCVTAGAVAVPVALALAADEASFAAAMGAGYATGIALGEAVGGVSALPETWPGLFAAPAIAAVTASTALGLAPEMKAQALVLALAGSSGRNGRPSGTPSARWLAIGEATLKGTRAALAARSQFKGDLELLSPQWLKAQSPVAAEWPLPRPDTMALAGLKPFVAARQGLNAIEAFRRLIAEGTDPRAIEEIRVSLPPEAVGVVGRPLNPGDRLSTIAHLGLQLGIAAFEPERLTDVARTEPFGPDAHALSERVTVIPDASLSAQSRASWPARIAVRLGSEWIERLCHAIPGDPGNDVEARKLVAQKIAAVSAGDSETERALTDLAAMEAGSIGRASEMLHRALARAKGSQTRELRSAVGA